MTITADRDPRIDPQTGDIVISSTGIRRYVTYRNGGNVSYAGRVKLKCICCISTWREWCRKNNAEVVE